MFVDRLARLDNVVIQGIIDRKRPLNLNFWVINDEPSMRGCVMGYAAMDLKFYNQGLHMIMFSEAAPAEVVPLTLNVAEELRTHQQLEVINLCFGDHRDFDAISAFFDISLDAAFYIFHRSEYSNKRGVTAQMVRTRLRHVIRNNGYAPNEERQVMLKTA